MLDQEVAHQVTGSFP